MDFIKNWIFCVCTTLILAVIFSVLTPKGSMGKFYKIIISMFIFVSFLFPITNAKAGDFKIDFPAFSDTYNESIENAGKSNVENIIVEKLKEQGINGAASAKVDFKNNEINITEIIVYIPDGNSKSNVKDYLLKELGLAVEVKYIGE